ncbi:MAG: hypothetical protein AAF611_08615 [Bacteroidota bacterium]
MLYKFREKLETHIDVTDEMWEYIRQDLTVLHVKRREKLVRFSELSRYIYFVVQGSFESSILLPNGISKTVWFYLDKILDIATCFDSIFLQLPTKYEITALEDSIVIRYTKKNIDKWGEKYNMIYKFGVHDIMEDFIATSEIRNHLISYSSKDFISYLSERYPIILDRIPDKNIAQFMGITPEWFSKLKRQLNGSDHSSNEL